MAVGGGVGIPRLDELEAGQLPIPWQDKLPRTPLGRSSEKSPSTHSGE